MRAVITGGGGFLGSHLCELMLERGWEVLCLDNLVTGSETNITHLMTNPKFRFARHDVSLMASMSTLGASLAEPIVSGRLGPAPGANTTRSKRTFSILSTCIITIFFNAIKLPSNWPPQKIWASSSFHQTTRAASYQTPPKS